MIKIGATEVDTIKIGSTDVDKVMLGGDQLYPSGSGFAITQHPANQSGEVGDTVFTLTVGYVPPEATVQWQWRNPTENKPDFSDINCDPPLDPDCSTGDTYTMNGGTLVIEQNDDRFRAVVSLAGESDIASNEAIITVEYGAQTPLTGDAATFLAKPASHTYFGAKPAGWNKTMEELPSNRVFPEGQKMFISGFNPSLSLVAEASASGFTIMGPWRNTYNNIKSNFADYRIKDDDTIQIVGYIRNMRAVNNPGGCISCCFDGDNYSCDTLVCTGAIAEKTAQELITIGESEIDLYRADENLQGYKIHSWLYCLDDWGADTNDLTKLHAVMGGFNSYLGSQAVGNIVKGNPWMSSSNYSRYMPEATQMQAQTYWDGGTCPMTAYSSARSLLHYSYLGQYSSRIDEFHQSPSGVPRINPVQLIAAPYSRVVQSDVDNGKSSWFLDQNSEYMKRELTVSLLNGLMGGCNGYTHYDLDRSPAGGCANATTQDYRDDVMYASFDLIKTLTDHGVDRALLWGKGAQRQMGDHTNGSTLRVEYDSSGYHTMPITPTHISGDQNCAFFSNPDLDSNNLPTGWAYLSLNPKSILYRDIQYKGIRFVIVTNNIPDYEIQRDVNVVPLASNGGVVVSDFSGFPQNGQTIITDILTGDDYTTTSGTVRLTMQPNTAVILKVEAGPGFVNP